MKTPRRLCVVTGSRADYGLLYWLMKDIQADPDLQLQIIATGMHLSPEFGLTWRNIVSDGFEIDRKVEMLLSSDTPVGIAKATGLGIIGFADALEELQPDMLIILGDRFEIFAAAQAAMHLRIPIAHIHGGELTEGAVDDAIRHAISKMSHLHFTAAEGYRQRVIQLGEQPDRVFNVGAIGLDNIHRLSLLSKQALEEALDFKLGHRNLLVTFHPVTLENATAQEQLGQLLEALEALDAFEDTHIIFTHSNADAEGRVISKMLENFRALHPDRVATYVSLGSLRYLSTMRHVDAVVGNSSSGIIEAPALKVPTINIGDRQKGRLLADSVLSCLPLAEDIRQMMTIAFSDSFKKRIQTQTNPYGDGGASLTIKQHLKRTSLENLLKKSFYNLSA